MFSLLPIHTRLIACLHLRIRILADSGPLQGRPNLLAGTVRSLDFLGTYCLATIDVDGFDGLSMLVYFSLNQALELDIREDP